LRKGNRGRNRGKGSREAGERVAEAADDWVPDCSAAATKRNDGANRGYCSNYGKVLKHFSSITAKIRL